jgi:hypothetical protein
MSSGTSVVNGWSGYYPPHYAPLVWAVGRGDARPIHELAAASGPIGVSLDKRNLGNRDIEAAVARLPSARRVELHPDWGTYIVSSEAVPPAALGSRLAVSNVTVNRQPQDAGRMLDARVDTGWGSGARQDGTEEVIVDLGESRRLGAVVLPMAHFAFGFPRELWIDVSADTHTWQTAWSGPTAAATVRAALADPERVPLTFEIGGQAARFLRLRQTAPDEVVPWWIAEVEVYGPP